MSDLFQSSRLEAQSPHPLADRMRPATLEDVVGQDHLLGGEGTLTRILRSGQLPCLIFWGPPGTGKTTVARLLADRTDLDFHQISAIFSGVGDLRKVFETARVRRLSGRGTLLFVDEIHRFNRAQQDAFLPYMEDGTITLVGATTENPSFALNNALLSRSQVLTFRRLEDSALAALVERVDEEDGRLNLTAEARARLVELADGDGRALLSMAEIALNAGDDKQLDAESLALLLQRRALLYDRSQDEHYNIISALHKSVRGSDPDAALYWFSRMLAGGEDPLYIARRIVRMASEDIGLADPNALTQALAAKEAYDFLGSPEGELALAQAVVYCATAPKSNAVYKAAKAAMGSARQSGSLMPPKHILNAPTGFMKDEGYGDGYAYDHDTEEGFSGQSYFPDDMPRPTFYDPPERGFERDIKKRLAYWAKLREGETS